LYQFLIYKKVLHEILTDVYYCILGGCKHAVAVLMWLHRRSSEPSPTEIQCYWRKSVLSSAATSIKIKTAQESGYKTPLDESNLDNSNFLSKIVKQAEEKQLDSQLSRYCFKLKERQVLQLFLHQMLIDFLSIGKSTADDFIVFTCSRMSASLCKEAEIRTRDQSNLNLNNNILWYPMVESHHLSYTKLPIARLVIEVWSECNWSSQGVRHPRNARKNTREKDYLLLLIQILKILSKLL